MALDFRKYGLVHNSKLWSIFPICLLQKPSLILPGEADNSRLGETVPSSLQKGLHPAEVVALSNTRGGGIEGVRPKSSQLQRKTKEVGLLARHPEVFSSYSGSSDSSLI